MENVISEHLQKIEKQLEMLNSKIENFFGYVFSDFRERIRKKEKEEGRLTLELMNLDGGMA